MKIEFPVDFGKNVKVGNLGMGTVFLSLDRVYSVIDYGGLINADDISPDVIIVSDLIYSTLITINKNEIVIPLDCTLKVNGRLEGDE